ncbi:hypothetical protein TSOC_003321 [Tetrabaena socialis]|uniref:Uncharacterized protein n=1 Tax=Tetrabaena socialis TaxID=47790 RepID=A0A2J8ABS8_9CHLO|nr:hypothetical protein TSOC_003321 [Tetrabaena socialis]|eukprot:PNH09982.1 hypothetical protein TSOC_003321 [Tetrabaena socialis]
MVYKPSFKRGGSRIMVEIPNITAADIESFLGSGLFARAAKGPKTVTVVTKAEDFLTLFGGRLEKSLRYGATLKVHDEALKLVLSKESMMLKVTGTCVMYK